MRGWLWCVWFVCVMTGGRCHRRKKTKTMDREEGVGVDCVDTARIPTVVEVERGIDFYSQAKKALCERSPYDVGGEDSSGLVSAVLTLPSALASLLKHSDSRKRHKKSNSGAEAKASKPGEKLKAPSIWVETEEYFRNLTLPDIDTLFDASSFSSLASNKCLSIPILENELELNADCGQNMDVGNEIELVIKEEVKEDRQLMEIDTVGNDDLAQEENSSSVSDKPSGLEWLLVSRNKIHLTSERPSKKRKLLGSDAGLEKVLIACPCDGNSSICNFCGVGDARVESNLLIVCNSCNVAVHRKCYGVLEGVEDSWLCSWCKQKTDDSDSANASCVLCPKQGGALKPVHKGDENGGSIEFAHLFCCQWMPEVYIEDLKAMEPIMNVGEIKEARRKLVCNICKVKRGACVRCSHGTCRAAFHPICAREASNRMEIWGKYGCDNVELRAFCSKHSEVQDSRSTTRVVNPTISVGSNSHIPNHLPATSSVNNPPKFEDGCRNGDNATICTETPHATSDRFPDNELQEMFLSESRLNAKLMSECIDADQLVRTEIVQRTNSEGVNTSHRNFALILKKLIERGKVNVKDVASEIGISSDSLAATLADDCSDPDLDRKLFKWFKNNIYTGTHQQNLKIRYVVPSKSEIGAADGSDGVAVSESENPDPVTVKSIPPRRRTKSNLRIVKGNKVICSSKDNFEGNQILKEELKVEKLVSEDADNASEVTIHDATDKKIAKPDWSRDSLVAHSPTSEAKTSNCSFSESGQSETITIPGQSCLLNANQENPVLPVATPLPQIIKTESSRCYIHPYILKTLVQMHSGVLENTNGAVEGEVCHGEASSNASISCNQQNLEQLVKAKHMGVLELSPEDEVEGEIIYFQHTLLSNAVARKRFTDDLMSNVAKSLPQEIDAVRAQRWDNVLANQYLSELREAKKLGRKERRHKEAQAVLAAATAAAAASSRISSFRIDAPEESTPPENLLKLNNGRGGPCSQLMPRPKETLSKVTAPKKEHPRSCDICRRTETILKPILVCSSCKVAVHLDCYRSFKESTGPWNCEICEELSSARCGGAPTVNFWQKPFFVAECALCGGTTGAFRKSTGGQWVHAFCAEWVFEATFRRGQVNPVEGMETISKGINVCCICRKKHGTCIKCNNGHCQTTFHPSCARSADYFMSVKNVNGKLQHKAYCENHSREQKAKAENQKHGMEELKSIKQIRVELERLRLLCERIVKREKVKRELVQRSHAILALEREQVALSMIVHSPFFPPEVSSESATTSVKGHADGYRSCSEAIQRSDDITMDSSVSLNRGVGVLVNDTDQKTDESSTFQNFFTRRSTERTQFSGKKIPHRPSLTSHNLSEDEERKLKFRKHTETFEKELVMTSDQASMRNQQLPKGYVYVPVDRLPKEQIDQDASSGGPLEHDG